ncbi:HDOD domain-containing protein [Marinomonas sp. 15G1-11]|uniref:HDOD domain-containing protein n=1 Tax=Marinomonas phaeophyticola TaxID=3004091 RepID=A0ABT4JNY7_9GAMM|nr:HDOD domain-containing protein [Marinomonas sp. 15G1-11]MCZ2720083.1 HDOD domain-containing protein [Marinomonas sp. 15G1-11]
MKENNNPLNDLMMAQQPIFDINNELFGYELLFRGQEEKFANFTNGEAATSQVLVNLCIGITELNVQLNTPFFINMTGDLLLSDAFFPIDPSQVYIEILEEQKVTATLIEKVSSWKDAGYHFVLDDYQFTKEYDPLIPLVKMIKIDVLATHPERHKEQISSLLKQGIILIAEKVENQSMLQLCRKMGFTLFQGYYLQKPTIVKGKKVDSATQMTVELVSELQNPDISIDRVAKLVEKNPKFSYQLLRVLNSPICGIPKKVESIKEAVIFIGLNQIKKWALLITLTSTSNQPIEMFRVILIRAYCCQTMCRINGKLNEETGFIAGIMSGIDAILEIDKQEALNQIALSDEVKRIILHYEGDIGKYLKLLNSLERNSWDEISAIPAKSKLILSRCYGEGVLWANAILKAIA